MTSQKNLLRYCEECHNEYSPNSHNSKYCKKDIILDCLNCQKNVKTVCAEYKKKYCNSSCRNQYTRAHKYQIKEPRNCIICKKNFKPSSSKQYVCNSEHPKACEFCGESYLVITQKHLRSDNAYCDNVCSTFAQTNSSIDRTKISQYKSIDTWAKDFKNLYKRKPTEADFKVYFNVRRLPRKYDRSLFLKKSDSRFELIVIKHIEESFPMFAINRRYRKKINGKWLEIDIYIPELSFGVEVQDFKTHSRDSETTLDPFGNFKKGPRYHQAKIDSYQKIGVDVIEIWEDEILDGSFTKPLDQKIRSELSLK